MRGFMKLWPWSEIADLKLRLRVEALDAKNWRDAFYAKSAQLDEARAHIAKFDHDNDGKPGGSKPRLVK